MKDTRRKIDFYGASEVLDELQDVMLPTRFLQGFFQIAKSEAEIEASRVALSQSIINEHAEKDENGEPKRTEEGLVLFKPDFSEEQFRKAIFDLLSEPMEYEKLSLSESELGQVKFTPKQFSFIQLFM